jgi:hypothetical protein
VLAAASALLPAELAVKPRKYLVAMASASTAGVDVPGHIYTSNKQVLADYIVEIRPEKLKAKQRGEIQLLLLAQTAQHSGVPTPVAQQARTSALLTCPAAVSCNCNRQAAAARGKGRNARCSPSSGVTQLGEKCLY